MKHQDSTTLVLSGNDIQQIVRHRGINVIMDQLIQRLEAATKSYEPGQTEIPVRSGFHYSQPHQGLIEWMPLMERGADIIIKVVGYHPENPTAYQKPTILSTISAYDTTTGHLTGLMDGVFPTALRTGAASALASKYLARPDSSKLGLIGCGAQAVTQLHALSRVFPIREVLLFDIDKATEASFTTRCKILNLDVVFIPATIEEIVSNADIVCTATSIDVGAGPLFELMPTQPHLHINAVGSDFPGKVEVSLELLKRSFVSPDFHEQAIREGECQRLSPDEIGPEIVEVVKNGAKYQPIKNKLSVYDSTGFPLQDKVVFELFMEYALKLGLGKTIEIELINKDVKNPYHFVSEAIKSSPSEAI